MDFEMSQQRNGYTYRFTETNNSESIEYIINKIIQNREEFHCRNNVSPEKVFMDALTYKRLEMSYGEDLSFSNMIQIYENIKPTIMGMNIEVLPTKEFFIMLGYNDCNDNIRLGLFK